MTEMNTNVRHKFVWGYVQLLVNVNHKVIKVFMVWQSTCLVIVMAEMQRCKLYLNAQFCLLKSISWILINVFAISFLHFNKISLSGGEWNNTLRFVFK